MQATELQALARQPRRIPGARAAGPSADWLSRTYPAAAAAAAAGCAAGAFALLLIADPERLPAQFAFYLASLLAVFLAATVGARGWVRRRGSPFASWRGSAVVGLVLAAGVALAFLGMRMGLGPYWPLPPAVLLLACGVARNRILRA